MLFSEIAPSIDARKSYLLKAPPAPQAAARRSLPETHISADKSSQVFLSDSRPRTDVWLPSRPWECNGHTGRTGVCRVNKLKCPL